MDSIFTTIFSLMKDVGVMYISFIKNYFYAWVSISLLGIILADIYDIKKESFTKKIETKYYIKNDNKF